MAEKYKGGRPAKYTQEIADFLCEQISTSSLGLRRLHKKYPDKIPHPSIIFRWINDNSAFREQYRNAKELQMEFLEEELLEIADDSSNDIQIVHSNSGNTYENENKEFVNRSKLRIHTRMWLMGKIKPKVYGKQAEAEKPKESNEIIIKVLRDGQSS